MNPARPPVTPLLVKQALAHLPPENRPLYEAAPEMFAALKRAQPALESLAHGGAYGNSVAEQILDEIRAALAAARYRA